MVIAKPVVDAFRARTELRDSERTKALSKSRVEALLREKGAVYETYPPRQHQQVCELLGITRGSYYFCLDLGLGKTKISIDLMLTLKPRKSLVLVPYSTNVGEWEDQLAEHAPSLVGFGFADNLTREEKLEAILGDDNDVIIMTYMAWFALCTTRVERKKKKSAVDKKQFAKLASQFDLAVFDEATAFKNHQSITYDLCKRLGDFVKHRFCLSGTPFDKNPVDLWSQFHVVDNGEALGSTLGLFRQAFFKEVKGWRGWPEYKFDPANSELLNRFLRHSSIRYKSEECSDLPPTIGGLVSGHLDVTRVGMPPEMREHYEQLLALAKEQVDSTEKLKNIYSAMRLLTGGTVTFFTSEGERSYAPLSVQPKLDALMEYLEGVPPDVKIIIAHDFIRSGELIADRMTASKRKFVQVFGKTKNKLELVRQFKTDPKTRILVGSRAICYGLNLQVASYMLIYESPDSTILRRQLEGRVVRTGQTRPTFIRDFAIRGSVDIKLLRALEAGKGLFDEIVEARPEKRFELL